MRSNAKQMKLITTNETVNHTKADECEYGMKTAILAI